ncbi:hypothetical protein BGW38_007965 [Lunasporangiospora selenospora]|uniref:Oxidoreductase N-terminal domain-containing protein n=1 Tax=Lunasporangiospora selenospora TaxID=979761 RepID=A0A9P6FK08_9FUNG|nr:hypothetical protein BGW38_007965 [Lunasporangiospora selenospora]
MTTKNYQNKSVIFVKHPQGLPLPGQHLAVKNDTQEVDLKEGELLLRNLLVSVDPYLLERMNGIKDLYIPSFELGHPLDSNGVSEVVESKNDKFPVGSVVIGSIRWENYTVVGVNNDLKHIPNARESKLPLSNYIGVLGMPGLTAYGGLLKYGSPKAGETLFVSSALELLVNSLVRLPSNLVSEWLEVLAVMIRSIT